MAPKESKMRNNAMKTCTAGAMLIGGVLGASSAASAGLAWQADWFGMGNERTLEVANVEISTGWTATAYEMDAFGAATWSDAANAPGTSVSFSGLTLSGENANSWSTSAIVSGASAGYDPLASFNALPFCFSVTGTQQVTLTTAAGLAGGSSWTIWDPSGALFRSFESTVGTPTAANTQTFTLSEGQYYMNVHMEAGAGFSGNMFSFTVPAPGAAALVGIAGLMARRRKA
jgi:hypothetical protein